MKRDVQGIVLVLVGGAVLRICWDDTYLSYVKESMRPWLLASGGLLVALGLLLIADVLRQSGRSEESAPEHGHRHRGGSRSAWLLLVPIVAIFVIAPPSLGAYTAARATTNVAAPASPKAPPLPATDPVPLLLADYAARAVWDAGLTLQGRTVQLVGFVTPDPAGGWWLTRLSLTCCAADATTVRVKAIGARDLPANTWVRVVGRWTPGGGTASDAAIPWVQPATVTEIRKPKNPYE